MAKPKAVRAVAVDFETQGIDGRPHYPPVPVGVSIKWPGKKSRYYAWGHLSENNCSWGEGYAALKAAYDSDIPLVFQNGKFDVDVAEVHMGLPIPRWDRVHDTMFLLFLDDPHQKELGIKPSAARLLGHDPEERDAIGEWLISRQPVPGVRISKSKNSDHYYGRYISHAPGGLVGKYAESDTDSTAGIFDLLYQKTVDRGMLEAYDRERRLMPILLGMERRGLQVDLNRLRADVGRYRAVQVQVDGWLRTKLKVGSECNFDSGEQLVAAMVAADAVDTGLMPLTATGKYQTNKEALLLGVKDKVLLAMLKYRTQLKTALGTFMENWLEVAELSNGRIFTTWNQVRSPSGDHTSGARTGRLSSTPPFMNLPKEFRPIWRHEEKDPAKAKKLSVCPIKDLPPLPKVRSYVIPFPGHVIIDRDYSQQEPRILAHFDGGALMDKYVENPWIDFHDYARDELANSGKIYDRKPVKDINLGLIYGMGVPKLAVKTELPVAEVKDLKKAVLALYPGLADMYKDMKHRAATNQPIKTWGGREYYCEPPRLIEGRMKHFDYKLVNVLIQGSAADCTKQAMIEFSDAVEVAGMSDKWFLILNVHDQLTASVPIPDRDRAMAVLKASMEGIKFDVPMLSEGAYTTDNWDALEPYDTKGKLVVPVPKAKAQRTMGASKR